jgi:hypothetical protein
MRVILRSSFDSEENNSFGNYLLSTLLLQCFLLINERSVLEQFFVLLVTGRLAIDKYTILNVFLIKV